MNIFLITVLTIRIKLRESTSIDWIRHSLKEITTGLIIVNII